MMYKIEKRSKKKINSNVISFSIIILLISIATCATIYSNNINKVIDAKETYEYADTTMSLSAVVDQGDYVVQRINEKYRNSNIEVYYPVTKYELLNAELKNITDAKIAKFKEDIKDNVEYSMFINFDMYKYNDYISFVFHLLEDYAGAHPNTYIFTINYDIKNNCIINIDTLISKNNDILNLMSKYTYNSLSNDEKIKEINMSYMVIDGTKPIKTNFENFIFSNEGLIIFFERYQVAPYSYGEFWVTIPYEQLNLKINE